MSEFKIYSLLYNSDRFAYLAPQMTLLFLIQFSMKYIIWMKFTCSDIWEGDWEHRKERGEKALYG